MPRDAGRLADKEIVIDNSSRMEPKRSHQWFIDSTGPELFSNKKQAVEPVGNRPLMGTSHMNISPWNNASSFHSVSGQSSDRLFGSDLLRTNNDGIAPGNGHMNIARKEFNDSYGSNCSMGLSMSHSIEDPSLSISFGGIRKVKVNQVGDIATSMGHSYGRGDDSAIQMDMGYNKRDCKTISLGPTYNNEDENTFSLSPMFSKADGSFISMGHTFNRDDGNFISMGLNYNKGEENVLSIGQPFDKEDGNFVTVGPSYDKEGNNFISMAPSYNKGTENFVSVGPTYHKLSENFISRGPSFSKEDDNIISNGPIYEKSDSNITSVAAAQDKGNSGFLSMGDNYYKGASNNISFGGFHDEPETNLSGNITSGYDMLMSSGQTSELSGQNNSTQTNADPHLNTAPEVNADPQPTSALKVKSKTDASTKIKEPKTSKKVPSNNFPSNVKSLLSTGLLDGVPVKYVSWSREKTLRGTIKGACYLCGCKECNLNKALNAYEFERHANCKTKHPNNHIYFENGKTIYGVVQELKSTPQEKLFDAIQSVTGSPINEKNFRTWKASYQAATRELQRIYGKDEFTVPS